MDELRAGYEAEIEAKEKEEAQEDEEDSQQGEEETVVDFGEEATNTER